MFPLFLREVPKLFLLLVHSLEATEMWLFLKTTALALQQTFFMYASGAVGSASVCQCLLTFRGGDSSSY